MFSEMECTQRLECTQELYSTQREKICPEQIGFLGICGTKYPVKKGPNKIGRDPQTCSIILNLNSVSRHHAVINILNHKDYMLMDLSSANKTKLSGKTLQPYMPYPLHNGDTVQFGEIFGIFRLLEDEDDLPITQAIDIPDTPVPVKHASRVNAVTTIPESPDVSDRDDSFIIPSQPKGQHFQSPKTRNFIKPGKTISIQPVGTNKIDNIYWNSSKKSTSLILDDSNGNLNDSIQADKDVKREGVSNAIHEQETPDFVPFHKVKNDNDSIHTANTQDLDDAASTIHEANTQITAGISPTIHSLNTQIPAGSSHSTHNLNTPMPWGTSSSIHSLNTQVPGAFGSPSIYAVGTEEPAGDKLPEVCKINEQQDMQFDLCANKSNDDSIYNAETQMLSAAKDNALVSSPKINDSPSNDKLNTSNEEVFFTDVDNQPFEGFESQPILFDDIILPVNGLVEPDIDSQSQIVKPKSAKRSMRIKSDSSTDCDDIDMLPTQIIPKKKVDNDDDTTDCDEETIEIKTEKIKTTKAETSKLVENVEDMATQVIVLVEARSKPKEDLDLEDMLTQVLDIDAIENDAMTGKENLNTDLDFEDLPTQVLDEDLPIKKQYNSHKLSSNEDEITPFKVPLTSSLKQKKYVSKTPKIRPISNIYKAISSNADDDRYYENTQDIFDDLLTPKIGLQKEIPKTQVNNTKSVEKVSPKSSHKEKDKSNTLVLDTSFSVVDAKKEVNDFVTNLSSQDVRDVIGVDAQVSKVKVHSDGSSDLDVTPKKLRPFKFMDIDLPNSQEIKTSVSISAKSIFTESSSESDTENNSEDQSTPILFSRKKKTKHEAKRDLTKKFNVEALPTRVITRVRKPTAKIQDQESKAVSMNILKPTFLTDQDGDIDKEIITENITRLKSKNEKLKSAKSNNETSEDIKPAIIAEQNITETAKKECDSLNKPQLKRKEKLNKHLSQEAKGSSKDVKRKKREPKNNKQELINANKSSIMSKSTKSSLDSTAESKDKIHIPNKSKEIETLDLTESPVETKRSTRSTRSVKTKDKPTNIENKSTSPEPESVIEKPRRRKYTRKQDPIRDSKKEVQKEKTPEKELRRSRRQIAKDKNDGPVIKSILKKSVPIEDESVVYNVSSGSNSDFHCSFKRPALDDSDVPSAKRTRSVVINNVSLRATPARMGKTQYVLFTAFPYDAVKVKLENMGAVVVTDVMESTVVLTRQIKRTFKLLCTVGLGKPIVGPDWVQACVDTNMIVDPWLYLIKDTATEQRFGFSLERTLTGKRDFLKGYNVSSTPSVMPAPHELRLIVQCSGGTWKEGGPNWICLSVSADLKLWAGLRERGAVVVSTEFILTGVLRQKIEIEANRYK